MEFFDDPMPNVDNQEQYTYNPMQNMNNQTQRAANQIPNLNNPTPINPQNSFNSFYDRVKLVGQTISTAPEYAFQKTKKAVQFACAAPTMAYNKTLNYAAQTAIDFKNGRYASNPDTQNKVNMAIQGLKEFFYKRKENLTDTVNVVVKDSVKSVLSGGITGVLESVDKGVSDYITKTSTYKFIADPCKKIYENCGPVYNKIYEVGAPVCTAIGKNLAPVCNEIGKNLAPLCAEILDNTKNAATNLNNNIDQIYDGTHRWLYTPKAIYENKRALWISLNKEHITKLEDAIIEEINAFKIYRKSWKFKDSTTCLHCIQELQSKLEIALYIELFEIEKNYFNQAKNWRTDGLHLIAERLTNHFLKINLNPQNQSQKLKKIESYFKTISLKLQSLKLDQQDIAKRIKNSSWSSYISIPNFLRIDTLDLSSLPDAVKNSSLYTTLYTTLSVAALKINNGTHPWVYSSESIKENEEKLYQAEQLKIEQAQQIADKQAELNRQEIIISDLENEIEFEVNKLEALQENRNINNEYEYANMLEWIDRLQWQLEATLYQSCMFIKNNLMILKLQKLAEIDQDKELFIANLEIDLDKIETKITTLKIAQNDIKQDQAKIAKEALDRQKEEAKLMGIEDQRNLKIKAELLKIEDQKKLEIEIERLSIEKLRQNQLSPDEIIYAIEIRKELLVFIENKIEKIDENIRMAQITMDDEIVNEMHLQNLENGKMQTLLFIERLKQEIIVLQKPIIENNVKAILTKFALTAAWFASGIF